MSKVGRISVTAGLLVAGLIGGFLAERMRPSEAVAQGPAVKAPAEASRFQISSFAHAGPNNAPEAKYGAYIIDTVTGEAYIVDGTGSVTKVGRVPQK